MSALPNSKSSLLYATRSCSALALAGAIILPVTPALARMLLQILLRRLVPSRMIASMRTLLLLLMSSIPT